MGEPSTRRSLVRFGRYSADLRSGELYRDGVRVKLQERPFEILTLLLERPGEVVTRDEMQARLWQDGTFVDFEHSISSAVGKLREALGDSAAAPHYVETVGSRGYRFIAAVELAAETKAADASARVATAPLPAKKAASGTVIAASVVAVVVIAGAVYVARRAAESRHRFPAPHVVLAVLPFANLTGDFEQEYLSDGITEEMITQLARLDPQALGVISRTSVMAYKANGHKLAEVGRELGVDYVVEGGVRRDHDRIRITAQLIRVKDQTTVWAREYDRELQNLLALQTEIAQEIADEIQLTLENHRVAALHPLESPQNYEAYDLYLKGLYFLNQRTGSGFEQAGRFFQQATVEDPKYARAYAGLADTYALVADYGPDPAGAMMEKARAAALKALQLDPSVPEAHTALALIVQSHDWDWATAEKEFRRAIELNPNYATAHQWYAEHLMWRGRFGEALRESELARQLDPLSLIIAADNAAILYYSRDYERAIAKLRSVLQLDPHFPRAFLIVAALAEKKDVGEAESFLETHRAEMSPPYYWVFAAHIYGRSGQTERGLHAVRELLQLNGRTAIDPVMLAWACAATGQKEQTLTWLEKGYREHSNRLAGLKVNPLFDGVRDDPRFQSLLLRVGLAR